PADVDLLGVADLADRGAAAHVDPADRAGRQTERGVGPLLAEQLDSGAGRTGHLGAASRAELHRVHDGARGDAAERQVVAGLDVGGRARLDLHSLFVVVRGEVVALLPYICVMEGDV